jgi:DNA-binding MarR family transcriptional regulator
MQALSERRAADERSSSALQTARSLATLVPRLNRLFRGQVRPAAGLSMPQFIALRALRHGPLAAGELAERFGVSRPTITRMVDGLVKKGLVERRPGAEDRRIALTSLTAQGRALHEATEASAIESLAGLLDGLPSERLGRLEAALGDLVEALAADPRVAVPRSHEGGALPRG